MSCEPGRAGVIVSKMRLLFSILFISGFRDFVETRKTSFSLSESLELIA